MELKLKPSEELRALYAQEKANELAELKAKLEKEEQARFFNRPEAQADYAHWSKASYWTLDEAIILSFGKAPEVVSWKRIEPLTQISPFAQQYARRRDLVIRAKAMKQLYDPAIPGFFLAWAKRNNIPYPDELETAVDAHGHQVADWKTRFDELQKLVDVAAEGGKRQLERIATLEGDRDALRNELEQLHAHAQSSLKERPLLTRERETALKLIIGMAVEQYGYDPDASRNDSIKNIAEDLAELGLSLDVDTVRKWLKEGAELLPREGK